MTNPQAEASAKVFTGIGVVMLVSALASALCSGLPWAYATSSGMGNGDGEGEYGAIKISMGMLLEGAFLAVAVILFVGALSSFAWGKVLRLRGRDRA